MTCTNASRSEGYAAAKKLLSHALPPDGIMTITDQLAAGAMSCAHELGINIPKDLSIIGYSDSEISRSVAPQLSTINQDGYEIGRLAKQYLIEMCHNEGVVHQKVFPSELIVRQST